MLSDPMPQALADLAVLADPVRRRLYLHVLAAPEPVSREAAAGALGIGRALAAFHLDRLVESGLLATEFRRLGERRGPGAGRPSKLYRPSARELVATLPRRRYDIAAEVFASALDELPAAGEVVARFARHHGRPLGEEARRRAGTRAGAAERLDAVTSVLRDAGYGPQRSGHEMRLRNCPFRTVAEGHRAVTCGMNLALIGELLETAGLSPGAARLDIQPEQCCVVIDAKQAPPHRRATNERKDSPCA